METLTFFENLGFPIAVCAVLFSILSFFIKKTLELIKEYLDKALEKEQKHQEFMCSLVKETVSVIASNTNAYNNFSVVLGDLSTTIRLIKDSK